MGKCLNCGTEIPKEKDKRQKFCNRSCSATYNNKKRSPKGWTKWKCIDCGKKVYTGNIRCQRCFRLHKQEGFDSRTLSDVKNEGNSRMAWSAVRTRANTKMQLAGIEKVCKHCGIDEPIDCCHIKDITSFSLDTLVGEVNSLDNLVYLCKNHHWLFDHGKLELT